jgi:glutamate-ammonia-ligase adenylyltransferase
MPELAQLENELIGRHPEKWVRHHLASFPSDYFRTFAGTDISRYLESLRQLTEECPVKVCAEREEDDVWKVEIVGYDAFQLLSTVCTLLAVRGLSIREGRVFTSNPPPPDPVAAASRRIAAPRRPPRPGAEGEPDRRPRIVDVLRVQPIHPQDAPPDWEEFQAELAGMTRLLRGDQYDEVNHRLIRRFVAALGPIQPGGNGLEAIDVTFDVEGSESATGVRIKVRDSFGFLSLTASALALCGIRIVQAEIRTDAGAVDDVLWVTDRWGHKITSEPKLRELRLSLILIEHFSSRLPRAADPEAALLHFSRFATETMARPDWAEEFEALERPEVLDALVRVLGESHFLWEDYLHAQPENVLPLICDPSRRTRAPGPVQLEAELGQAMGAASSAEGRSRAVRRFRDREIFRADLRSILEVSQGLEQFSAELSDVAEVTLRAAYALALEETRPLLARAGIDRMPPSVLCALGKFGGRELGFASDLEVLIVHDERGIACDRHGHAVGGFFDAAVAALQGVLGGREGHTFDLDFRLRPYGRAGSPATSLSTFLNYYRGGGPAWGYERQALIKLRVIAGDPALGREIESHRDRYVYGPERFDQDCSRRLRRLQIDQLVQPGTINAKYSPGALVDVEYFVQALQIAHGSVDSRLRTPNTLLALAALGGAGILTDAQSASLRSGYVFFRLLIDALRVVRGHAKDLTLPPFGSEEFVLLSRRFRAPGPEPLRDELEARLAATRALTERLPELISMAPPDRFILN